MRVEGCLAALAVILVTCSYIKAADYVVSVTCAGELELYTDRSRTAVVTHNNKTTSKQVKIDDSTKVISIKCTVRDSTAEAGILASVQMEYPGDYITDATWKCSNSREYGWTTSRFDDSDWTYATVTGNNYNSQPSGLNKVTEIDKYANWIWTNNYKTRNRDMNAYCRGHVEIIRTYDNYGRLFAIGFMENQLYNGTSTIPDIKLLFSTLQPTDVSVRISTPLRDHNDSLYENVVLTVKAGEDVSHKLPKDGTKSLRHMVSSTYETKAIRVIATADVKIVGENQDQCSDLFLTIPINPLGMFDETNEYYMICYDAGSDSRMLFIAAYDNTTLKITPSVDLSFNGNHPAGVPFEVPLEKYQSIQFGTTTGCTGTYVISNKPISAYSGNKKTAVKYNGTSDHLVEQMLPVEVWGKEYIITPLIYGNGTLEANGVMAIYVIVAAADRTNVTIKTYDESTGNLVKSEDVILNKGKSYSFEPDKDNIVVVTSDMGIMMVQISTTKEKGCKGDPWSQVMPPTYQYESDYSLLTPTLQNNGGLCPAKHYITIIVPDAEKDGIILQGGCRGNNITISNYKSVPETDYVEQTIAIEIENSTTCRVRHIKTTVSFAVYFYGYGFEDSYATIGGMRMAPIFEPCTPTSLRSRMGDGIDNNCNGKIDETACYYSYKGSDCAPQAPIEGGWSSWTNGTCVCPPGSVAGDSGDRTNIRECNNPVPRYNGAPCEGSSTSTPQNCICETKDGEYGNWQAWSDCTASCGGTKTRQRYCYPPEYGGENCTGNATVTEKCYPCRDFTKADQQAQVISTITALIIAGFVGGVGIACITVIAIMVRNSKKWEKEEKAKNESPADDDVEDLDVIQSD